jgi:hypothetical protein
VSGSCHANGAGGDTGLADAGNDNSGGQNTLDAGSGGGKITPIYPDAGAGGAGTGGIGVGGQGGCVLGAYDYFASAGGLTGTGGAVPTGGAGNLPTCPVDADGIATLDQPTMCGLYRCAATADELLMGLTCTPGTPAAGEMRLTKGCGSQVVSAGDSNFSYQAAFDSTGATPLGVEIRTATPGGSCNALGYREGTMPASCDSATLYRCVHSDTTGAYAGCRAASEPSCHTCCTTYTGGCNVQTTTDATAGYNYYTSLESAVCPCNCMPCATCPTNTETQFRLMPVLAQCHCPPPPPPGTGGSPGSGGNGPGGDPCDNYCGTRNQALAQCPGILPQ